MSHKSRFHLVLDTAARKRHAMANERAASVQRTRKLAAVADASLNEAIRDDAGSPRDVLEVQRGKSMTGDEFAKRVQRLNRNILFIPAKNAPGKLGLYYRDGSTLHNGYPEYNGLAYMGFVCEQGFMPEFSVIQKPADATKEPVETMRGWRTVLAKLVKMRRLTLTQVELEFGQPSRASQLWHTAIQ